MSKRNIEEVEADKADKADNTATTTSKQKTKDTNETTNGMKEVYEECNKLANEWYMREYDIRACTQYDSKSIDGELYLSLRASEQLSKDRDAYYEKLVNERSVRVPFLSRDLAQGLNHSFD